MSDSRSPFDYATDTRRVFRVLGPPGTGKTTWLVEQATRAVEAYGEAAVRVVSMTKSASREFARRNSPLPSENVSTLHALAYRGIGRPGVIGSKEIALWNAEQPGYALSGAPSAEQIDAGPIQSNGSTNGDDLLSKLDLYRSRRGNGRELSGTLLDFAEKFSAWKREIDRVDFTGMLERALEECPVAPDRPDVLFVDEAQDLSTLELELVEQWGRSCRVVVLVGDPDQSLYNWRGADRRVLLEEDGTPPFKILSQSHRVPKGVHETALGIIRRSSTWSRAEYRPNEMNGIVDRIQSNFRRPDAVLDNLERESFENPLVESVMVLATCGYMVKKLVDELRRRGIGYYNPYRAEWNPLARGSSEKITGADRLLAFARLETPRDWKLSLSVLMSESHGGPLRRGAKVLLESFPEDAPRSKVVELLNKVLLPGGLDLLEHGGSGVDPSPAAVEAWRSACTATARESMDFPLAVYRKSGRKGLERPKVVVGTVHSVKGGEAEHVYLATTLSPSAYSQMMDGFGWDGPDALWRTFYVGATRAKERLVLCGTGRGFDVDI